MQTHLAIAGPVHKTIAEMKRVLLKLRVRCFRIDREHLSDPSGNVLRSNDQYLYSEGHAI